MPSPISWFRVFLFLSLSLFSPTRFQSKRSNLRFDSKAREIVEKEVRFVQKLSSSSPLLARCSSASFSSTASSERQPALEKIFSETKFDVVIHCAGLKAVGESVAKPLLYYDNNLVGTIVLLEVMAQHGCKNLVFSSVATVHGAPKEVPCTEESPISALNPYGRTKLFIEEICRDVYGSDPEWKIILLRYFNPVGAHPSSHIGEDDKIELVNLLKINKKTQFLQ
ncbi:hypothetical protein AALP_AA6G349600, partial [Arabis alpina]